MEYKTIGQSIKELREKRGLSQEELGFMVDMTKGNISQVENDKRNLYAYRLEDFAKALEVHPGYFFGYEEPQNDSMTQSIMGLIQTIKNPSLMQLAVEQLKAIVESPLNKDINV